MATPQGLISLSVSSLSLFLYLSMPMSPCLSLSLSLALALPPPSIYTSLLALAAVSYSVTLLASLSLSLFWPPISLGLCLSCCFFLPSYLDGFSLDIVFVKGLRFLLVAALVVSASALFAK